MKFIEKNRSGRISSRGFSIRFHSRMSWGCVTLEGCVTETVHVAQCACRIKMARFSIRRSRDLSSLQKKPKWPVLTIPIMINIFAIEAIWQKKVAGQGHKHFYQINLSKPELNLFWKNYIHAYWVKELGQIDQRTTILHIGLNWCKGCIQITVLGSRMSDFDPFSIKHGWTKFAKEFFRFSFRHDFGR